MSDEDIARVEEIAGIKWRIGGVEAPLISAEEVYNLSIKRGTFNAEEREVINNHIVMTVEMLEQIGRAHV